MQNKNPKPGKTLKILKKEKTQKILQYWADKPNKWIQSCKLREEFVKKYSNVKTHSSGFYIDPSTMKKYSSKPKPLYNEDSDFYRDLRELVDLKILENNKSHTERGMPKSYYRPCKKYKREGIRIQNKTALDFFSSDNIKSFPIKPNEPTTQRILYGLSDEIYGLFDDNDRKKIKANLDEIEKNIQEISILKMKAYNEETDRGVQEFLDNTKSNTIKSLLREDGFSFIGMFHHSMVLNKNTPHDIYHSKDKFFYHFGLLTGKYSPSHVYVQKEILDFMRDYFFEGGKYTNKSPEFRIKKFCSIWSLCYFKKDYGFSLSDITELIQWGWDNRDFFEMFAPMSIAFSRYDEYETNPLTKESVR